MRLRARWAARNLRKPDEGGGGEEGDPGDAKKAEVGCFEGVREPLLRLHVPVHLAAGVGGDVDRFQDAEGTGDQGEGGGEGEERASHGRDHCIDGALNRISARTSADTAGAGVWNRPCQVEGNGPGIAGCGEPDEIIGKWKSLWTPRRQSGGGFSGSSS